MTASMMIQITHRTISIINITGTPNGVAKIPHHSHKSLQIVCFPSRVFSKSFTNHQLSFGYGLALPDPSKTPTPVIPDADRESMRFSDRRGSIAPPCCKTTDSLSRRSRGGFAAAAQTALASAGLA